MAIGEGREVSNQMKQIVTLTMNPSVDKNSATDRVVPEHKVRCDEPTYEPGGGGLNVSRALRRLGGESVAVYLAGGRSGAKLGDLLREDGLDAVCIQTEEETRENLTIFEASSTLQYRFNMPGPRIKESEWKRGLDTIQQLNPEPDYLIISGSLPPGIPDDFYKRVVKLFKRQDVEFIVDTSGPALRHAVEAGVSMIKINAGELASLAGREIESDDDIVETGRHLIKQGKVKSIVVTLGAAGAVVVTEHGRDRVPAPTVPIRSKVGAGDSTMAGIAIKLAQGRDIFEAIRYGIAAGSAAVMTPGTELCRLEDVERLFECLNAECREFGLAGTGASHVDKKG